MKSNLHKRAAFILIIFLCVTTISIIVLSKANKKDVLLADLAFINDSINKHAPVTLLPADQQQWLLGDYQDFIETLPIFISKHAHQKYLQQYMDGFDDYHFTLTVHSDDTAHYPIPDIGLQTDSENNLRITVGTFGHQQIIDNKPVSEHFEKLYTELQATNNRKHIVIDVRGNPGGDPHLAFRLILTIFGSALAQQVEDTVFNPPQTINFKVTDENIAYFESFDYLHAELQAMLRAAADNASLAHYQLPVAPLLDDAKSIKPPTGDVTVVLDTACGSSCAWFVREISKFPNVILVGEPSVKIRKGAYYREKTLPSEIGYFGFVIGAETHPTSDHGQSIKPTVKN